MRSKLSKNGVKLETIDKDITEILANWPKTPDSITARIIEGADGQALLQIRLDCGILQMYLDGRPDGEEPFGYQTFLEYLEQKVIRFGDVNKVVSEEELSIFNIWDELDREMTQFYHRRIGLLAVARDAQRESKISIAKQAFHRAARDADYSLRAIEFISNYCESESYIEEHKGFEPFIIWHKTLAVAQIYLLDKKLDESIEYIKGGIKRIEDIYQARGFGKYAKKDPAIAQLKKLERLIRGRYGIKATLQEQLKLAIEREDYEQAAKIRDKLYKRGNIDSFFIPI